MKQIKTRTHVSTRKHTRVSVCYSKRSDVGTVVCHVCSSTDAQTHLHTYFPTTSIDEAVLTEGQVMTARVDA